MINVPTWDGLNIRNGPSTEYKVIGELLANSRDINVIGSMSVGGVLWAKIKWQRVTGW